jgi:hypothetical protein
MRPRRRLIEFGERFTSAELETGEVELTEVKPIPEIPEQAQNESWNVQEGPANGD